MISKKPQVTLLGSGKISKVVYHYVCQEWQITSFAIEKPFVKNIEIVDGILDRDLDELIEKKLLHSAFVAIGYDQLNSTRERLVERLMENSIKINNFISKNSFVSDILVNGVNNIIFDNVTIHPGVTIGSNNFVWSQSLVSHGVTIGDNNWITGSATLCGDCRLGNNNFIGAGATIAHNVIVEDNCFIGANALVEKNLRSGSVIVSGKSKVLPMDARRFINFIE